MTLDPSQQRAVDLMLTAPIGVVTGGPGRGKTHCTKEALDLLDRRGVSYQLAASTGKAARRLSDMTGREALTIHRLLGYPLGQYRGGFLYGPEDPIETDLVIVDEASMIDVQLGAALLDAVQPPTRIVLIGDVDQLPPVGEGCVFADLIRSGVCPVARLDTVHRAAAESWVCTQSPAILAGRVPDLSPRPDFRWIECERRDDAVNEVVRLVGGDASSGPLGATLREMGVESVGDVQVLVPMTKGPASTRVMNRRLQSLLNPNHGGPAWELGTEDDRFRLCVGDRVIQTKNNYELGVMNGEIGHVERIDTESATVRYEGAAATYDRSKAREIQLAYALTVHRLQGSEVPWAVVFCHSTHSRMLERTLLYTAVTRAKRGVVLVGDRVGLERAVKNAQSKKRNTGLAERLREGLGAANDDNAACAAEGATT